MWRCICADDAGRFETPDAVLLGRRSGSRGWRQEPASPVGVMGMSDTGQSRTLSKLRALNTTGHDNDKAWHSEQAAPLAGARGELDRFGRRGDGGYDQRSDGATRFWVRDGSVAAARRGPGQRSVLIVLAPECSASTPVASAVQSASAITIRVSTTAPVDDTSCQEGLLSGRPLTRVSHFSGWKWRRRPVGAGLWFEALSRR